MIAYTVKVELDNGNVVEKELYFNYTKLELTEMNFSKNESYQKYLENSAAEMDGKKVFKIFKDFILGAYGEQTEDGRFYKSPQLTSIFAVSEEFSSLIDDIFSVDEPSKMMSFIKGILPRSVSKEMDKNMTNSLPSNN